MVQEPERQVDHVTGARGDLGAATKTGEIVADVAVVLLDREGRILAGEELLRRNQSVKAFPVVGQEDTALDADLVEKSAAGRIITPTQSQARVAVPQGRRPAGPNFFSRSRSAASRRSARPRSTAGPRLRHGLAGRARPPVDHDVADAQELRDGAWLRIPHGVEQDRPRPSSPSGYPRSGVAVEVTTTGLTEDRARSRRSVPFFRRTPARRTLFHSPRPTCLPIPRWNPHIRPSIYG